MKSTNYLNTMNSQANKTEAEFLNEMKTELDRMIRENFNPYLLIIEIKKRLEAIEEKATK